MRYCSCKVTAIKFSVFHPTTVQKSMQAAHFTNTSPLICYTFFLFPSSEQVRWEATSSLDSIISEIPTRMNHIIKVTFSKRYYTGVYWSRILSLPLCYNIILLVVLTARRDVEIWRFCDNKDRQNRLLHSLCMHVG